MTWVKDPKTFGPESPGSTEAQQLRGFNVSDLFQIVNNATVSATSKLQEIQSRRSSISIGDMFEMQMLMNKLSQVSEMASNAVSAANQAVTRMAQNLK